MYEDCTKLTDKPRRTYLLTLNPDKTFPKRWNCVLPSSVFTDHCWRKRNVIRDILSWMQNDRRLTDQSLALDKHVHNYPFPCGVGHRDVHCHCRVCGTCDLQGPFWRRCWGLYFDCVPQAVSARARVDDFQICVVTFVTISSSVG